MKNKKSNYLIFLTIWLLIILPKVLQMPVLIIELIILIRNNGMKLKMRPVIFPIFIFSIIQFFSVIFNFFQGYGTDRIFAGLNTAITWFVGLTFMIIYSNIEIDVHKISKYLTINLTILNVFALISTILMEFNIPLEIMGRRLYRLDWFLGTSTTRLMAFMEYPNLAMLFGLLLFPWMVYYLKDKNKILLIVSVLLSAYSIYLTKSRMGILIVLAVLFYLIGIEFIKNFYLRYIFFSTIIIIMLLMLSRMSDVTDTIVDIINGREGSTTAREGLYSSSINIAINTHPLIGMGIKVMNPLYGVPYGSHSTYIGMIYKAGIIGATIGFFGFLTIVVKLLSVSLKHKYAYFGFVYLAFFLTLVGEDLDGNNWLLSLAFSLIAIIIFHMKEFNDEKKNKKHISENLD